MSEYGLIKDTTVQDIADSVRNIGLLPKYTQEAITSFKYKSPTATSLDDPTPTENPGAISLRVTIPEATKVKLTMKFAYSGYGNMGTLYFYKITNNLTYDSRTLGYGNFAETPLVITIASNDFRIATERKSSAYLGFIVEAIPLDAEGNPITIYKDTDNIQKYSLEELTEALTNSAPVPPESAYKITDSLTYRFNGGGWDWFIDKYGDRITTEDLTSMSYSFVDSKVTRIPFTINLKNANALTDAFKNMTKLQECPKVRGTLYNTTSLTLSNAIDNVTNLRDFEDMFTNEMLEDFKNIKCTGTYSCAKPIRFNQCHSMRKLPSWWYQFRLCEDSTAFPNTSYTIYSSSIAWCYSLDEVLNIPVIKCGAPATSNMFSSCFNYASRVKDITFETNNGQPIVANWKSQTIDLTTTGWGGGGSVDGIEAVADYSGVTRDKKVTDDASYQALKNDPDWYTSLEAYSRYDHDSAVRTINSLPDTSAYLASTSGTNTIKFKKTLGSSTDGGAISTLTAEEIAVATAKGWTVTLV